MYKLSQMKTNQSIIASSLTKPVETFLVWVTTFHFARLIHRQCKHHVSSYLFTLHKDNTKVLPQKVFPTAWPFVTGSLQTFFFFSHILHLFQHKSKLRMKVSKYNCDFHFWVVNVIMKFSSRQWSYDKAHRTGCLVGKSWTPYANIKSCSIQN